MSSPSVHASALDFLAKFRQALQLVAAIESLPDPLTSADGLREAINSLVQLASLLGVNNAWTSKLAGILQNPALLNVVQSVIQYVLGNTPAAPGTAAPTSQTHSISEETLNEWLPPVAHLLHVLGQMRGDR